MQGVKISKKKKNSDECLRIGSRVQSRWYHFSEFPIKIRRISSCRFVLFAALYVTRYARTLFLSAIISKRDIYRRLDGVHYFNTFLIIFRTDFNGDFFFLSVVTLTKI